MHYEVLVYSYDSFNTQPPEGGWFICQGSAVYHHGFNTQPPEGGWQPELWRGWHSRCFNTQPPEGGWVLLLLKTEALYQFQHAAARRRLGAMYYGVSTVIEVSTRSRPKAAGGRA